MKKNSQAEFYSGEASAYEATRYGSRYGRMFRLVQRAAIRRSLVPADRILDVATGTGQMLPVLSEFGSSVVASDLTPAMLKEARRIFADDERIAYSVGDACRLPYRDGAFDIVASSRFLHLFDQSTQAALISEMARVLRPGGTLIVDFYSSDARRIFALPVAIYRVLLRKRPENDYRVSICEARDMIAAAGLSVERVDGLGNFILAPIAWLNLSAICSLAEWLGCIFPRMSEQFLVTAKKS